jgi:hypothetical protein
MVMMHELAHCKEMNHAAGSNFPILLSLFATDASSTGFWKVRNGYASDMKDLWAKGYTGDGLWGKGVLLENGMFTRDELDEGEVLPEHMCGGTFKSRGGKKRKAKPKITYKEQKERRIRKKFGTNGVALGADEEVKTKLEKGKKPAGKPRVAGSARGRELRAAAALARFEVKKEESQIKDEELVTDSEAESEDEVQIKAEQDDAVDIDGTRLVDRTGHGMVRVCDDEDKNDENVKNELRELQSMHSIPRFSQPALVASQSKATASSTASAPSQRAKLPDTSQPAKGVRTSDPKGTSTSSPKSELKKENIPPPAAKKPPVSTTEASCQVCSVVNDQMALTCVVCANVLKPEFVPNSWSCSSSTCRDGEYINAGDVGLCGVCSTRKS